jgi:hypothetical protein
LRFQAGALRKGIEENEMSRTRVAITGLTCMIYKALPVWSQSDTAPGNDARPPESKRLLGVILTNLWRWP